jgi:hypothetical protein
MRGEILALIDKHYGFVKVGDSRKKTTEVVFRVNVIEAGLYYNATTQILKDATELGQLLLSVEDLSAGSMMGKGVRLVTVDDAVDLFDKLGVSYVAGIDGYSMTIPARDTAAYTVADDGVTVVTGLADPVDDFIARFNAIVIGKNTLAAEVEKITVVS